MMIPLSPTYMPYFPPDHSPLRSSTNTRQRDDYESSSHSDHSSPSLQVLVSLTDGEDCRAPLDSHAIFIEGYPVWEAPFASEPALEGELEEGLPPLKKLKPDNDYVAGGSRFDKTSAEGIVLLGAVKGILTRRTGLSGLSSTITHIPSASSSLCDETFFAPWNDTLGLELDSISSQSSASLSRRSSSSTSSGCSASIKAVRFASASGLPDSQGVVGCSDPSLSILPGEVEGPVVAIMYLTHSAAAYDRSPIVVEKGLRLPPRAKQEDDADDDEPALTIMSTSKLPIPQERQRTKTIVADLKISPNLQLCTSPESPLSADCEEEISIIIKSPLRLTKTYRENEEEEDENDEDETNDQAAEEEEEEEGSGDDESEDKHSNRHYQFGRSSQDGWGLGNWSSGDVFGCCDALGGF